MPFGKEQEKKKGNRPQIYGLVSTIEENREDSKQIGKVSLWEKEQSAKATSPIFSGNIEFTMPGNIAEGERVHIALWRRKEDAA